MRHPLIVAALIAILPLSAPVIGQAQHPADTARPHPAPKAHANAVAGQADAARIEACTHATDTLIDNLEKGDYKAATADFDATMSANLGADKLGEVWQSIGAQAGKLEHRGTAQSAMYQGHTIVALPLHFQKADVNAQVACDANDKVAGFFLRPAAAPAASAPGSSG